MDGTMFGQIIAAAIIVVVLVYIAVKLLAWLYLRSSKDSAFVRTGMGGEKVVLDGGAFVLPVVHDVVTLNMNTARIEVKRGQDRALVTRDRMRVDVIVEFHVRVAARADAVSAAAQTLGRNMADPERLKEMIEGRLVDALRSGAAEVSIEELHERRADYVRQVREAVSKDLARNGLELEAVSLTHLEQTATEYFNPSNQFDAEGLTRLTQQIEQRRKERNDIEQDSMVSIRRKNIEVEKLSLGLEHESALTRLSHERDIELARAAQRTLLAQDKADTDLAAESAQISSRQAIDNARVKSEASVEGERIRKSLSLQTAEVERQQSIQLAEQRREIALAEHAKLQSEALAAADLARAAAVEAEESVVTARSVAVAERNSRVAVIEAEQQAERDAARIRIAAQAARAASEDHGMALRTEAQAQADAKMIAAEATRMHYAIDAEGARLLNEAENVLSDAARSGALRLKLVERMEAIIRESVRPMEKIDSIKIVQVDGLHAGGGGGNGNASNGIADEVVNAALKYRAHAPLIDELLKEVGMEGGDVRKFSAGLLGSSTDSLSASK
jgi:uncharacterized membrane protein YqiK